MSKSERIRVKEKDTGHHVTIAAHRFLEDAHVLLKQPAVDKYGRDVPPKFHVTKGGSPAKAAPAKAAPPAGDADATKQNEETK